MKYISHIVLSLLFFTSIVFAQKHEVKLTNPKSFSFILLPDPQNYSKFDTNQPVFELMTAWSVYQKDRLKVKAVLCTGDLVEQNEILIPDGINGNQTSKEQWEAASKAFERLDNELPYVIALGNHDYGFKNGENRQTNFTKYFFPERNKQWRNSLVEVFENNFGTATLENAAFEIIQPNWRKILVISVEFAPREEVLEWSKSLAKSEKYKDHFIILLTHSYLHGNNNRIQQESYKISPANYGEDIWKKTVYPSSNIRLVISGHYCKIGNYEENVGYRVDKNHKDKSVHQMMFNAQTDGGGWHGNGGNGWLRILEFLPDGKTIKIKTYSPLLGYSPLTEHLSWRTDSYDQFDMIFE